ncbi:MAG: fasciclin domain-containing protein [Odoribacter sp.]|nr:fasciclin domain-containing protein [Odoribacter sp.]
MFTYDQSVGLFEPLSSGLSYMLAVYQDGYPFSMFGALLRSAGLANASSETLSFSDYFVFIPSNDAISNAIQAGRIPGVVADNLESNGYAVTNASELAEYLRYYFVSINASGMSDYPYVGSGINREFATFAAGYTASLLIVDDGSRISITNNDRSQTVYVDNVYDQFPIAYQDGGFHIIEDVIEYVNN